MKRAPERESREGRAELAAPSVHRPWYMPLDAVPTAFATSDRQVRRVAAYLADLGYRGDPSYAAQRGFLEAVASEIDLRRSRRGRHTFNPRLVQQALYLFRGASNRRANPDDCLTRAPLSCQTCPASLVAACRVKPEAVVRRRRLPGAP